MPTLLLSARQNRRCPETPARLHRSEKVRHSCPPLARAQDFIKDIASWLLDDPISYVPSFCPHFLASLCSLRSFAAGSLCFLRYLLLIYTFVLTVKHVTLTP